ncbi:MAG: hypothetical protein J0L86_05035 [Flavobacteriales bacterium]|nr:hypothetical protein [Flavobacteriales bacterium]
MFKTIRTSKVTKFIIYYLCIMLFLQITQPMSAYALTEGPSQPEFNSFTPIGTSDMVNLANGDFNYNIPIMDVGGYPINLSYDSGVTMDQEASWVGLGWNLNIGQINRNIRGIPDDFKGDEMVTENNMKKNVTVSVFPYINLQAFGTGDNTASGANTSLSVGGGIEIKHNNYTGLSANPSISAGLNLGKNVSIGLALSSSDDLGASITPTVSLSTNKSKVDQFGNQFSGKFTGGITYNSRQGLQNFNLSSSLNHTNSLGDKRKENTNNETQSASWGSGGSISFANTTFTPTKRVEMINEQIMFSFSLGGSVQGIQGEGSISASASAQEIKDKVKTEKAYGYENTHFASGMDVLDFNRENESSVVSQNTNVLPVTNYTYDILSIQSQSVNGMIRPFRGQTGFVYDPIAIDQSVSTSVSAEIELGWGAHYGASIKHTSTKNFTSLWNTTATPYFLDSNSNTIDYERVYFKNVGESTVDEEFGILKNNLGAEKPIALKISGTNAMNTFFKKSQTSTYNTDFTALSPFTTSNLKRNNRELRNSEIQKITKSQAIEYSMNDTFIKINDNAKNHHTAAYLITDTNGTRHIFGETVYNTEKNEVTFSTESPNINCERRTVTYNPGENTRDNRSGIDHYFNKIKTGPYAHTYLISSVLSSDYQDLTHNGPTDDDLGSYTKFEYTKPGEIGYSNNYNWRVPYKANEASYNEGFKTDSRDQKASYLHGVKEVKYIKRIETKTHVALFDLEERRDGYGANGENGGLSTSTPNKSYRLKSIRLYAKKIGNTANFPTATDKPIKTAHFEYDYSLCGNVDNNSGIPQAGSDNTNKGKLTLTKVYFTYQDSNMGKYTPYTFTYNAENNYATYNPKSYDIWGNFKENTCSNYDGLSPQDFPFVDQSSREEQDKRATAWTLKEIKLPSGGKISLKMESDDYQFVQNKKAMMMYKLVGVTDKDQYGDFNTPQNHLYGSGYDATHAVVKVLTSSFSFPSNATETQKETEILRRCTEGLAGQPIYYDFLLNMTPNKYDHVTGYFEMDGQAEIGNGSNSGEKYLYIPMREVQREGENSSSELTNPISVAGWFFGRNNLYRQVYDLGEPQDGFPDIVGLGRSLVNNLQQMLDIFTGVNFRLKNTHGCAKEFKPEQSWIRLNEPTGYKLGGGSRVKSIVMYDAWEKMMVGNITSDDQRYEKKYGQEYDYKGEIGSSGVATYEPNMSKENPFVVPFYHEADRLSGQKYEEKPFGASFFPNPTVTYSKVTVKNITAADDDHINDPLIQQEVRKTRSGKVVTHHYTSYDFPTKTDFTDLIDNKTKSYFSNDEAAIPNIFLGMFGLGIGIKNELTLSQGFYIETNDMNGKVKKQEVFDNNDNLISYVENIYSVKEDDPATPSVNEADASSLDNEVYVVDKKGKISKKTIGVDYDVVNDFRMNYNYSNTSGGNANLDLLIVLPLPGIVPIPTVFRDNESTTQILRTAATTKVVNKTGILKEKIAYDLGSKVSTKNLAWDAQTGQVLVTQTFNEYDDSYYTLNHPAYWFYQGMDMGSKNIDIVGTLNHPTGGNQLNPNPFFKIQGVADASSVFTLGDELWIHDPVDDTWQNVWVFGFKQDEDANGVGVLLIDRNGNYIDECGTADVNYTFRIIRSGYRNHQMAGMSSLTLMRNPLDLVQGQLRINEYTGTGENPKIINASAIEYTDFWAPQDENGLPLYPNDNNFTNQQDITFPTKLEFNPYTKNYKGNWRPVKSYAFLTSRKSGVQGVSNSNTRHNGFFTNYSSFYQFDTQRERWTKEINGWTFASEVTQYSPYGNELENRDALNRFSSAQYGYQNTLPVAVASNSKYTQMGFDGFEDYGIPNMGVKHFDFETDHDDKKITQTTSHTGRKSIQLNPNTKTKLIRPLFTPLKNPLLVDCITAIKCPNIVQNIGSQGQISVCYNQQGAFTLDLIVTEQIDTFPDNTVVQINSFSEFALGQDVLNLNPINPIIDSNSNDSVFHLCYSTSTLYQTGTYYYKFKINYNQGFFHVVTLTLDVSQQNDQYGYPHNVVSIDSIHITPTCNQN